MFSVLEDQAEQENELVVLLKHNRAFSSFYLYRYQPASKSASMSLGQAWAVCNMARSTIVLLL